jgi:hypothetical protein
VTENGGSSHEISIMRAKCIVLDDGALDWQEIALATKEGDYD